MEKLQVIAALSALAQDTRLEIFRMLVQTGKDGLSVGRIGEALGLPSATLSFHLTQLKHAGLATCRRDGRSLIYSAHFDAMGGLMDYLTENCCAGNLAACGLDASACGTPDQTQLKENARS